MIQDDHSETDVLDALRESLFNHAQAHRVRSENSEASPISNGVIQKTLESLTTSRPSLFARTLAHVFGIVENIPRPFFDLRIKTVASYHFFGITGIILGCTYPILLTYFLNLSVGTTTILLFSSALLTWAYVKLTILITKKDAVVFFNYFLTLLTGAVLILRILNQPILVYMDIVILGAGLLFAFGRIGCFMAGCCYGKPNLIGIRYNKFHKKNGFPHALLSVRLMPIQLIESAWLFLITIICTALVFTTIIPGIALTSFLILLALGRFVFEFFRGDPYRPYMKGFSQAQWTSIGMMASVFILQVLGILPLEWWQSFILASFLILLIALTLRTKNVSLCSLYSATHLHEIANVFEVFKKGSLIPASTRKAIYVKTTSQNIQLSENRIPLKDRTALHHITLSSLGDQLSPQRAEGLARYMMGWHKQQGIHALLPDNDNVYHLIHFTIDTR